MSSNGSLRAPGSQGVKRGKSESEKNFGPCESCNHDGAGTVGGGSRPTEAVHPATKGVKGSGIR